MTDLATAAAPVRSSLLVAGSDPGAIAAAATAGADQVIFDLEAGVAPGAKLGAREAVVETLLSGAFAGRCAVRVNGTDTPWFHDDVVRLAGGVGGAFDALVLPEVCSARQVQLLDGLVDAVRSSARQAPAIGFELTIEAPAALVGLAEIAAASERVEALHFDADRFAAAIGVNRGDGAADREDWRRAPMNSVAAHAWALGLRAVDGPFTAADDPEGLVRSARAARDLGFDGKLCIRPDQVGPVNEAFANPVLAAAAAEGSR